MIIFHFIIFSIYVKFFNRLLVTVLKYIFKVNLLTLIITIAKLSNYSHGINKLLVVTFWMYRVINYGCMDTVRWWSPSPFCIFVVDFWSISFGLKLFCSIFLVKIQSNKQRLINNEMTKTKSAIRAEVIRNFHFFNQDSREWFSFIAHLIRVDPCHASHNAQISHNLH